jgi:hypothetical protein
MNQKTSPNGELLRSFRLSRYFVTALLVSLFMLAFVITPYWTLAPSTLNRLSIIVITFSVGILWAFGSASEVQLKWRGRQQAELIVIFALVIVLNYRALTSVIPWRGDEDLHILKTLDVVALVPNAWYFGGLLLFGLILFFAWKKSHWTIPIAVLTVVSALVLFNQANPFNGLTPDFLLRYPFVGYWFYAIIPKIASLTANPNQEILYRIIPALSTAVLVWILLSDSGNSPITSLFLWFLALVTIPIIFYYTSILYLELPVVCLMLIVCLRIQELLEKDLEALKNDPGWYALLFMGFLKETALPFLGCFLLLRLIYSLKHARFSSLQARSNQPNTKPTGLDTGSLIKELIIVLCILVPSFLYLYFRGSLALTRRYSLTLSNLFDLTIYPVMGRALIDQFGLSLIFFLIGCALLLRKKQHFNVWFFFLVIVGTSLFFALDNKTYVGYSRFNLDILPPILAGTKIFLDQIPRRNVWIGPVIAAIAICTNLLISPLNLDGTKKPLWGNYLTDTAEHYYPYRDALIWIKDNYGAEKILSTGMYYPYFSLKFYISQLDWHPRMDELSIGNESEFISSELSHKTHIEDVTQSLTQAELDGYSVVLYHVLGDKIPILQSGSHFHLEKIIRNQAHLLAIYTINP